MVKNIFILLLSFCILTYAEEKQDVVRVSLDKSRVKVGEIFTYKIQIKGEFFSPKLVLPEFKDFEIVNHSQSQKYSFSSGKTNLEFLITYKLLALKPGRFKLKEVIVLDRGKTFKSEELTIEVIGKPLKKEKPLDRPLLEEGFDI